MNIMNNDMDRAENKLTRHLREEDIVPYLEGKLPEARRDPLESHLHGCGECRTQLAELRSVMAEMDDWVVSEPPASPGSFDAAVRTRIATEGDAGSGWLTGWMQPAWGLTLGVFVLGAAGLWMLPRDTVTLEPDEVAIIVEADVDAIFQASSSDEGFVPGDELWMADYELIEEFDALFEEGENGSNQL